MLGLFGSLNMGRRSLQTQQQGIEVTGHNLANANNPAYARQRARIETAPTIANSTGVIGTGTQVAGVEQLRNSLVDRQIARETSVGGYWQTRHEALTSMQSGLGQEIDRHAAGPEGAAAAQGSGRQQGIAEGLQKFFGALQNLSTDPTSMAERQILLQEASSLATKFNNTAGRLDQLNSAINSSVTEDVSQANLLLTGVAKLNDQITTAEITSKGIANDLRDLRQSKLEELSKIMRFDSTEDATGSVNISVGGVLLVTKNSVTESLEAYDPGNGQLMVRANPSTTPLNLVGGRLQGSIETRDGSLATLQADIDSLAERLVNQVNGVHAAGFSLTGTTGENFFTGTDAASIGVSAVLTNNPGRVQASGVAGANGNNDVVRQMAQLADAPQSTLSGLTFSQSFSRTVSALGQELATADAQLNDQEAVEGMLKRQRDSFSGVSIDEEMTEMVKYQRAYQASARFINTIDQMLQTVVSLK